MHPVSEKTDYECEWKCGGWASTRRWPPRWPGNLTEDAFSWKCIKLSGFASAKSVERFTNSCTEKAAKELGLTVRAWIVTTAVAGCDWTRMGRGPIPATEKALRRADLALDQMDVIELNEAFAAQSLYVINEAGFSAEKRGC